MSVNILESIMGNIWFFQTESVIPIFAKFSIFILIIFILDFIIAYIIASSLAEEKIKPFSVFLFPITLIAGFFILYSTSPFFTYDFTSLDLGSIFSNLLKSGWVFIIFHPITFLLRLPFKLINHLIFKGEHPKIDVFAALGAGISEEIIHRFFAFNTFFSSICLGSGS